VLHQHFGDITIDRVTEAKLADYVDRRLSQPRQTESSA
jgi:hypothetical protein